MRALWARVAGLLGLRHSDKELDAEVGFHLEMLAREYERRGMSGPDARAAARREFGGVSQMKESYRDQRGLPLLEALLQDARYGVRTLLRTPGFTLAALLTIALGIGANTAIFSVVHAVLLRPLPFPEPDRIVTLVRMFGGVPGIALTGQRYMYFRDNLRSVDALGAYTGMGSFNFVAGDRTEFVSAFGVSKEYFSVLGVHPALGQGFTAEHDRPGGPDVAVLSHGLWQRQFGEQDVIGRTVLLGDKPHTIVGVMPASFRLWTAVDLFVPLQTSTTGRGSGFNYRVIGRLREGTTIETATAEAATLWRAYKAEHPEQFVRFREESSAAFLSLQDTLARPIRPSLLMMMVGVGILLLMACANTANLLLARASGRGREVAVRAALGAGRGRILRQLLTESLVLALAGAAVGVLLAYWTVPALLSLTPSGLLLNSAVEIDGTVLLVTWLVAIATGLVFGLAPALSLSRHDLVEAFKDDGGRTTAGRRTGVLRHLLVTGEVALCTLLLIAAGLLIQTFVKLRAVDPGFDPRGVLTARMSMRGDRYANPADLNRFYADGLERIRSLPGVRSAAITSGLPLEPALNMNVDVLDGPEKLENELTDWRYVTPAYFDTLRIPVVAGRVFSESDRAGAPPVAVVSEEFARRFFKGTSALGRHIRVFDRDGAMEIVGIVKDLKEGGLKASALAVMYVPAAQLHEAAARVTHGYFQVNWVVRADRPDAALGQQIAEEIRRVDPRQPFSAFPTINEIKRAGMASERFQTTLLGVFAAIGLLLAAAGIYGVTAYSVAQRTREFGIRMALGATRSRILRAVLWQGTIVAVVGTGIGVAAALGLTKTLQGFVWQVSPADPATFATVCVVLILVALGASVVPALRAVRLDPISALRE